MLHLPSQTFSLRRDPLWRVPLVLIGAVEATSQVVVREGLLDIRFGFYRARIPAAQVVGATPTPWPLHQGIGIRIGRDRTLALVGSTQGAVRLTLTDKAVSFLGFRSSSLVLSLDDPEGFVTAVDQLLAVHAPPRTP